MIKECTQTKHPYTLEKSDGSLRLIIEAQRDLPLFHLGGLILFSSLLIFHIGFQVLVFSILEITMGYIIANTIVLILEVFLILYFFSNYWWRKRGTEILTLYPNNLEYEQVNKPFKSIKTINHFDKIQFCYQSGEDFYSKEEALELGVELDLDKATGNYPIQFYLNNGEKVVDSEREIPIDVIKKMRDEYNKSISHKDL